MNTQTKSTNQSNNSIKNTKTYSIVLIALFAALTAVFSQISFPIGPIPINLGLLAVFISSGLLTVGKSVLSQAVFLLIGAVGVPVFANFKGGLSALVGPTGGYLLGYIISAFAISLILAKFGKKIYQIAIALSVGLIICYAFGTLWYVVSTNTSFIDALFLCVTPFIIGDVIKIIVATTLICKLKKFI